jgi:hypothetical protein
LRCFDEELLMTHPCEYLRFEDERFKLVRLDDETEKSSENSRLSEDVEMNDERV